MASAKISIFSETAAAVVAAAQQQQRAEALPDRIDVLDVNVPEWSPVSEGGSDAPAEESATNSSRDLLNSATAKLHRAEQYAALLSKERSDLSANIINYAVFVFVAVYGYEIDRRTNLLVIACMLVACFTLTTHVKARFNMAGQQRVPYGSGKLLPALNVRLMDIATYFIAFLLIQVITTRMRPLVADGHFSVSGLVLAALSFVLVYIQTHADQLRSEALHDPKDPYPYVEHTKNE